MPYVSRFLSVKKNAEYILNLFLLFYVAYLNQIDLFPYEQNMLEEKKVNL